MTLEIPRRRHGRLGPLIAALLVLGGLQGCDQNKKQAYVAPPPPKVTVARPVVRPVTLYDAYTGNTQAYASVEIRARVTGFLQKVLFTPSDRIKPGDTLFIIEPAPYQAKVEQAQADLAQAKAELKLAEATLVRKERAYKQRAVSEVDVIQAKAEMVKAQAGIKSAEASLADARIQLGYTQVTTPIEGLVSRSLVDAGNLVGSGEATLLTQVIDDDPMYAYFNVPEAVVIKHFEKEGRRPASLSGGHRTKYRVEMGPGGSGSFPYTGYIDYIDNHIDPSTGTIALRAVFDNARGILFPGMFVKVRLPLETIDKALLVPDPALGADQGGRYLLVLDDQDQVVHLPVKTGPMDGGLRVILEGLKPEMRVITKGLQRVRPGIKVAATEEKLDSAPPAEPGAKATPPSGS